jgi:hypothetical protein
MNDRNLSATNMFLSLESDNVRICLFLGSIATQIQMHPDPILIKVSSTIYIIIEQRDIGKNLTKQLCRAWLTSQRIFRLSYIKNLVKVWRSPVEKRNVNGFCVMSPGMS